MEKGKSVRKVPDGRDKRPQPNGGGQRRPNGNPQGAGSRGPAPSGAKSAQGHKGPKSANGTKPQQPKRQPAPKAVTTPAGGIVDWAEHVDSEVPLATKREYKIRLTPPDEITRILQKSLKRPLLRGIAKAPARSRQEEDEPTGARAGDEAAQDGYYIVDEEADINKMRVYNEKTRGSFGLAFSNLPTMAEVMDVPPETAPKGIAILYDEPRSRRLGGIMTPDARGTSTLIKSVQLEIKNVSSQHLEAHLNLPFYKDVPNKVLARTLYGGQSDHDIAPGATARLTCDLTHLADQGFLICADEIASEFGVRRLIATGYLFKTGGVEADADSVEISVSVRWEGFGPRTESEGPDRPFHLAETSYDNVFSLDQVWIDDTGKITQNKASREWDVETYTPSGQSYVAYGINISRSEPRHAYLEGRTAGGFYEPLPGPTGLNDSSARLVPTAVTVMDTYGSLDAVKSSKANDEARAQRDEELRALGRGVIKGETVAVRDDAAHARGAGPSRANGDTKSVNRHWFTTATNQFKLDLGSHTWKLFDESINAFTTFDTTYVDDPPMAQANIPITLVKPNAGLRSMRGEAFNQTTDLDAYEEKNHLMSRISTN